MAEDQRPGTIYWIDHFAVPSNDIDSWIKFQVNVLGAKIERINGLTTEARAQNRGIAAFCRTPYSMVDAFLSPEQLPGAADPRRDQHAVAAGRGASSLRNDRAVAQH